MDNSQLIHQDFDDKKDYKKLSKDKKRKNTIREILEYILIIEIFLAIFTFVLLSVRVTGPSMLPHLNHGDRGIMLRTSFYNKPKYNSVVVVEELDNFGLEEDIVKRVIGMPNDTVEIRNNQIYVNDELFDDSKRATNTKMDNYRVKLSNDEYFILGDNRNVSKDSRMIGPVKKNKIKAVGGFFYWPIKSIGFINNR